MKTNPDPIGPDGSSTERERVRLSTVRPSNLSGVHLRARLRFWVLVFDFWGGRGVGSGVWGCGCTFKGKGFRGLGFRV